MPDDPDRFLDYRTPGAQEWWYFDAIGHDGRDALVLVWYAGLPFDPDYGVATLTSLRAGSKTVAPNALDHCAIGFSWYREGKTAAYALNGFRHNDFRHDPFPFSVAIGSNRISRDEDGYRLAVDTPAVDGKSRIQADLRFLPAEGSASLERDLGGPDSPHLWILAAADCRVSGTISFEGRTSSKVDFRGRGYHDHNAGSDELSVAMRRWQWGRVQHGRSTEVYYEAESQRGERRGLWITCEDGRPLTVREPVSFAAEGPERNIFGVRDPKTLRVSDGQNTLLRRNLRCVDDGPFIGEAWPISASMAWKVPNSASRNGWTRGTCIGRSSTG